MEELKIENNMEEYFYKSNLYYKNYIKKFDLEIILPEDLEEKFIDIFYESWIAWNWESKLWFYKLFKMRMMWRFVYWYIKQKNDFYTKVQVESIESLSDYDSGIWYNYKYPEYKDRKDWYNKIFNDDTINILNLYFDWLTQQEIADKLNCSLTTIERRFRDIKNIIKQNEHLFL